MNEIKAIILCNNPIALPGIREFLFFGKVGAFVIPKRNKEMAHILESLLQDSDVPLLKVDRKNYKEVLTNAIPQYNISVGLMMTFPFIITPEILALPAKGFLNFHYGLLPHCRGPQPLLWHLLNNDAEAGITIHKVDEGIDTGDIVMQERIPLAENETYGTLQAKLAYTGARLAATLLKILSYGSMIPGTPQDHSKAAYYEMPDAARLTINWETMSSSQLIRLINACNPWNKGAGTTINNWLIGITEAAIAGESTEEKAGTIIACNAEEGLLVSTSDHKLLKINIIYTQEGFFSGSRLMEYGIKAGSVFS
jgi:methionyl-tRNA formyltransferase